jgi:hypothetical protein
MAKMHLTIEENTNWTGAIKTPIRGTDRDMAEAEAWKPKI